MPINGQGINWDYYKQAADTYLARPQFKGTPITGDMLMQAALNAYNKYQRVIPLGLALAQAQKETSMGLKGRNPSTNPFNVYEYDAGTGKKFKTLQEGINAYYDLLARRYMKQKTLAQLIRSFTNESGQRYASDPLYESYLRKQYPFIIDYINKNMGEP